MPLMLFRCCQGCETHSLHFGFAGSANLLRVSGRTLNGGMQACLWGSLPENNVDPPSCGGSSLGYLGFHSDPQTISADVPVVPQ